MHCCSSHLCSGGFGQEGSIAQLELNAPGQLVVSASTEVREDGGEEEKIASSLVLLLRLLR